MPIAVIAGGSGFIGGALSEALIADGYQLRFIGRNGPDASWGDQSAIREVVNGADVLVNLAGKSINCRYNDKNRNELYSSRIDTTRALAGALAEVKKPPKLWINASAASIYQYTLDTPQTEADGKIGGGFSVDLVRDWEKELFTSNLPNVRKVALRLAIVIGDGPATRLLFGLARLGVGGTQFDGWWFGHNRYRGIGPNATTYEDSYKNSEGRQKFSWIHIDDVIGAIRFVIANPKISGPVNFSAPETVDNRSLMATLRRVVGAPFGLPAWRFMIEPIMWLLRTESELVLKSRLVVPEKLLKAGYKFRFSGLEPALRDVYGNRKRAR